MHYPDSDITSICLIILHNAEYLAKNTNGIVFGLTQLDLESTIYSARRDENHYTTDAVLTITPTMRF
jgi:hypothetical protein